MVEIFDNQSSLNVNTSPIKTRSNRMVGAPAGAAPGPSYKKLDANQVAFRTMQGFQDRATAIENSDLPEEEKELLYREQQKAHEDVIAKSGSGFTEQSWIDPIDAIVGPLALTKTAAVTFGKLTAGVITGSGRLGGKSLVKALTVSLATEPLVGGVLEKVEESTPIDAPWYIKAAVPLTTGLVVGTLSQAAGENAITALTGAFNKRGIPVDVHDVQAAVKQGKKLIAEEIELVQVTKDILSPKKRKRVIGEFKAPKKGKVKKQTGKERADIERAARKPLFSSEPVKDPGSKYADLDRVKEEGIETGFEDSFIEAESVDEFFTSGPSARRLIEALKAKGYEGVIGSEAGTAKKFYMDEAIPEKNASKEFIQQAANHAGQNTVTSMTGGVLAGVEIDEEGNVSGYNINRAVAVTAALAIGTAGYSKFIAGQKGMKALPTKMKANKEFQLSIAKKLDAIDQPMDKIGLRTGVYKPEGQRGWRAYESDKEMSIKIKPEVDVTYRVGDLIQHPIMEKYYGKTLMAKTRVQIDPNIEGAGYYNSVEDLIKIKSFSTDEVFKKDMMHETEHAIQHFEGHSPGTSPSMMDSVVGQGLETARTPRDLRTLEQQQFLDDWTESIKVLDLPDRANVFKKIKEYQALIEGGDVPAITAKVKEIQKAYSTPAYNKAYGEVEAKAVEDSIYDNGPKNLKDLTKSGYIDAEKLIVSMWRAVVDQPTKETTDALSHLASKMDAENVPKDIFKRWEDYANNRIIDPIKFHISNRVYNDKAREAFGIHLPKKFREMKAAYDNQSNRTLDHTMTIAKRLDELAPTEKEQKRLMQVLRGGITSDPQLARAAAEVKVMYTDLREISLQSGLRDYDMYDALTKAERHQLSTTIRLSSNPKRVLAAQEQLQAHYRAGTSYEYVPVFLKTKEGVVGAERKALTKKLNQLKATARKATDLYDDEALPHLRDEIDEIESILAVNANNAFNTERKQLSQGYTNVTAPNEASKYLYDTEIGINSASFTAARGLTEQAVDIQRLSFLKAVEKNTDWVLPKKTDPTLVPQHFTRLKGEKYGPLDGAYVDKVIAKDIDDAGEVTNAFIRGWDKMLGLWKLGKAVFNPATHVANTTSNVFLAHLGGVNPGDVKTYGKAAQALRVRMKNKHFVEAESWGLMNNTFSAAELSQMRKTLASYRSHPKTITTGQKVKQVMSDVMQTPAALYEGNEQFFKMAVFIKARENGASIDQAAKRAEEYLFNYRDIPPVVRHYKRWASPFFTFTYKASGLFAKEAIRQPHKLAMWGATYMAMQKASEYMTNTSDAEVASDKRNMPGFGTFHILLPWKGEDGSSMYWDINRLIPLGQYEQKWGQTGLPIGTFMPTANPFTSAAYEIALNRDLFTGRDIINKDLDGFMAVLGKWGEHLYKEMTPSLAPGNHGYNSLMLGLKSLDKDIVDYTGQKVTAQDMIARTIFAVKVTPATRSAMFRSFKSEVMRIDRGIGKRVNQAKTKYQRGEMSREDFDKVRGKLMQQKRFFKERIYDRMKED